MRTLAFFLSVFFISLAAKPVVEVIMEKLRNSEHCAMKCCHSKKMAEHSKDPKKKCCGDQTEGCNPARCCFGFCCNALPGGPLNLVLNSESSLTIFPDHSSEADTGYGPDCFQPPELA